MIGYTDSSLQTLNKQQTYIYSEPGGHGFFFHVQIRTRKSWIFSMFEANAGGGGLQCCCLTRKYKQ